jgi:hypothetical protein
MFSTKAVSRHPVTDVQHMMLRSQYVFDSVYSGCQEEAAAAECSISLFQ